MSESCREIIDCGFSELVAKRDVIGGTLSLKRKARSKVSMYPNFVAV
jgi:hypothetical protein